MTNFNNFVEENLISVKIENTVTLCFDTLPSTNTYAKELAGRNEQKKNYVIFANGQTAGRGTRGRSFISEKECGIYLSILFYPDKKISPADITVYAAITVARAIESFVNLNCKIKWVNDIYVNGKKLCGILTEGKITDNSLDYAVVGIGINTHGEKLPEAIADIATTIEKECGVSLSRFALAEKIAESFLSGISLLGSKEIIKEYRARSLLTGKRVKVSLSNEEFSARVIDVSDSGALVIEKTDGNILEIQSGDISVKEEK